MMMMIIIIIIIIIIKAELFTLSLSCGILFNYVMNEIIIIFFAICDNLFPLL